MENYLAQNADDLCAGLTDLSVVKVRAGAPIILYPMNSYRMRVARWTMVPVWAFTWSQLEVLQFTQNGDSGEVVVSAHGKFDTHRKWVMFAIVKSLAMCGLGNIGVDFRMG